MFGARRRFGARKKTGFAAFCPIRPRRARPEQGLELAKLIILAVALALLRERRSYGLTLADLNSGASKLTKVN